MFSVSSKKRDKDGVTVKQSAQALDYPYFDELAKLIRRSSMGFEGKVVNTNLVLEGNHVVTLINYHGVIRASMLGKTDRARAFRDWAEEVLFEVMMRGNYGAARSSLEIDHQTLPLPFSALALITARGLAVPVGFGKEH